MVDALESLLAFRGPLQATVRMPRCKNAVKTYLQQKKNKVDPTAILLDDGWWEKVEVFVEVCVPARVLMRSTDGSKARAYRVYSLFSDLHNTYGEMKKDGSKSSAIRDAADEAQRLTVNRWNFVHRSIHAAGHCLDPANFAADMKNITFPERAADAFDTKLVEAEEDELEMGLGRVVTRVLGAEGVLDPTVQKAVNQEWAKLRSLEHGGWLANTGFTSDDITEMDAMEFWVTCGAHFPKLKSVALRIMCLRAGTHAVESLFSVLAGIQTKKRTRLDMSTIEKVAYVKWNRNKVLASRMDSPKFRSILRKRKADRAAADSTETAKRGRARTTASLLEGPAEDTQASHACADGGYGVDDDASMDERESVSSSDSDSGSA